VRPVSNEKQLQNLDALPTAQLRPEFREVNFLSRRAVTAGSVVGQAGAGDNRGWTLLPVSYQRQTPAAVGTTGVETSAEL